MIICFVFAPDTQRGMYANALSMFAIQKLMVALKYASLSPSEYERLMGVTDRQTAECHQRQLQLLAGMSGKFVKSAAYSKVILPMLPWRI